LAELEQLMPLPPALKAFLQSLPALPNDLSNIPGLGSPSAMPIGNGVPGLPTVPGFPPLPPPLPLPTLPNLGLPAPPG
jgi:hypothetical protein